MSKKKNMTKSINRYMQTCLEILALYKKTAPAVELEEEKNLEHVTAYLTNMIKLVNICQPEVHNYDDLMSMLAQEREFIFMKKPHLRK